MEMETHTMSFSSKRTNGEHRSGKRSNRLKVPNSNRLLPPAKPGAGYINRSALPPFAHFQPVAWPLLNRSKRSERASKRLLEFQPLSLNRSATGEQQHGKRYNFHRSPIIRLKENDAATTTRLVCSGRLL